MRLALMLLTTMLTPAMAEAGDASEYVTLQAGVFAVGDEQHDETMAGGIEYSATDYLPWGLQPMVGLQVSGEQAIYGYAGLRRDFALADHWVISPNVAVGLFEEGDGRDLGGAIEFRSGLELYYRFTNQHRVGVAFHHISNAGIYDANPGTETLMLHYGVPVYFGSK